MRTASGGEPPADKRARKNVAYSQKAGHFISVRKRRTCFDGGDGGRGVRAELDEVPHERRSLPISHFRRAAGYPMLAFEGQRLTQYRPSKGSSGISGTCLRRAAAYPIFAFEWQRLIHRTTHDIRQADGQLHEMTWVYNEELL